MTLDLFDISRQRGRIHPAFTAVRNSLAHTGARKLMNELFNEMGDSDGNFVDQFQTTGFHARIFEICCFAAVRENGYTVASLATPDFLIKKGSTEIAVEVTTSNSREDPYEDISVRALEKLTDEEIQEKIKNELPIRFGSSLFSKLSKRYWELDNCSGKPIILALGPFHESGSMTFTDTALAQYLYGIRQSHTFTNNGTLVINEEKVAQHKSGKKIIPSNFFGQPDTENISGVLYSNSFTVPKFLRMGIQFGGEFDSSIKDVVREGFCLDRDPNASQPLRFQHHLRNPKIPYEGWDQGGVLFLNPEAKYPISTDAFPTLQTVEYKEGDVVAHVRGFHPIQSITTLYSLNGEEENGKD